MNISIFKKNYSIHLKKHQNWILIERCALYTCRILDLPITALDKTPIWHCKSDVNKWNFRSVDITTHVYKSVESSLDHFNICEYRYPIDTDNHGKFQQLNTIHQRRTQDKRRTSVRETWRMGENTRRRNRPTNTMSIKTLGTWCQWSANMFNSLSLSPIAEHFIAVWAHCELLSVAILIKCSISWWFQTNLPPQ